MRGLLLSVLVCGWSAGVSRGDVPASAVSRFLGASLAQTGAGEGDERDASSVGATDALEAGGAGAALRFGAAGSTWWGLRGGVAVSGDATGYEGRWIVHHFLAEGFEVNGSLIGMYHDQDGDNEGSAGAEIGFRWHFIDRGAGGVGGGVAHTVYVDAGIGMMGSSGDVPVGGTSYNFTPRVGVGVTVRPWESAVRLDGGVGWHHISNASSAGSDDNPARDGVRVYLGVVFPF